jgi:hypothetical protein
MKGPSATVLPDASVERVMGDLELRAQAERYRELARDCGAAEVARLLEFYARAYEREAVAFERRCSEDAAPTA